MHKQLEEALAPTGYAQGVLVGQNAYILDVGIYPATGSSALHFRVAVRERTRKRDYGETPFFTIGEVSAYLDGICTALAGVRPKTRARYQEVWYMVPER